MPCIAQAPITASLVLASACCASPTCGLVVPVAPTARVVTSVTAGTPQDLYRITLDESVTDGPLTGRLMLFFITEKGPRWDGRQPISGPFFETPQPITSMAVENLQPGETITFDTSSFAFPGPLSELAGTLRVQAILDVDHTERSHTAGPSNVYSAPVSVNLATDRADTVELKLNRKVQPRPATADQMPQADGLHWVNLRSKLLSDFYGRDVFHRAGVAVPPGWDEPANADRRWGAVYVVPGFGGTHTGAASYARLMKTPDAEQYVPMAVHIVLDPESPLGHHGFVDSPNHGSRGTALVTELIPHLEEQFRLAARPEGRIITGHSSGGWSSLWLQLRWPDVFGACWSTAPDPIYFGCFQMSDIYQDDNIYEFSGQETPSYRQMDHAFRSIVRMTVREESQMEHAMHPHGGSGQQWDTWEAMFSPRDPQTGLPMQLFDAVTGEIDKDVVEHWRQFDITRLVYQNWSELGPVVRGKVRLACGLSDSFYLERAVEAFKEETERLNRETNFTGPGYVLLVPRATHGTLRGKIGQRIHNEMREHLRAHGLMER